MYGLKLKIKILADIKEMLSGIIITMCLKRQCRNGRNKTIRSIRVSILTVQDICLRGLRVPGFYKNLLDHVLDVLDARDVAGVVLLEEERDDPPELVGQRPVLSADRACGPEDGLGDLPVVEGNDPTVTLADLLDPTHQGPPLERQPQMNADERR